MRIGNSFEFTNIAASGKENKLSNKIRISFLFISFLKKSFGYITKLLNLQRSSKIVYDDQNSLVLQVTSPIMLKRLK